MEGWIKLHRKLLESPVFSNPELLKVWLWCLLKASHKEHRQMVGMQEVNLVEGQFIFGRKKASIELNISESKAYRAIKKLEKMGNLNIKTNNKFSIVTIENWCSHQNDEQQMNNKRTTNEQQMNNKRTTNEQQMNTNKNVKKGENEKNVKNDKNIHFYEEVIDYLNQKADTHYKSNTKKTQTLISARMKEGFTVEDFKTVIDKKSEEWINDVKFCKFLRPETLFGTKFESYLNQKGESSTTYKEPVRLTNEEIAEIDRLNELDPEFADIDF